MSLECQGGSTRTAGKVRRGFAPLLVKRLLSRLERGHLIVELPSGDTIEGRGALPGTEATLRLRSWRALRRLATGGALGFARAYIDGDWSSPDRVALIRLAAENAAMAKLRGLSLARLPDLLWHRRRGNTRRGSRRNIEFHYDLGNDFYRLWLDPGLSYSSALFEQPGQSLEAAQQAKLDHVLSLLAPAAGDRVLEIGCGWGGLAELLAVRGAAVTGVTLSPAQLAHGRARLAQAGLAADLRLQDYREVGGRFDRIVSIEMLEAVGEQYWPVYFQALRERLAPGGTAVLQVITIDEGRFDAYRRGVDFIQRYVFPGGLLPSRSRLRAEIRRAGLELTAVESFGHSYALTLAEWQRRFQDTWAESQALGFDGRFKRLWEYYLSYCEAGFRAGAIDVGFYCLRAAGERGGEVPVIPVGLSAPPRRTPGIRHRR